MKAAVTDINLPPHSLEAERSVLGAVLIDREAFPRALELVESGSFYRDSHRLIFDAMHRLYEAGGGLDLVCVVAELERTGQLERVGGASYISSLAAQTPTAANVFFHAGIIREKAALRHLERLTLEAQEMIRTGDPEAAVRILAYIEGNGAARNTLRAVPVADFLKHRFPPREDVLSPWLPGQGLAMIHAARGAGKTHVSLGIAAAVAAGESFMKWHAPKPRGVLYLDGEMPGVVMQERLSRAICAMKKGPTAPLLVVTPDIQEDGLPNLSTPEGQKFMEPHLAGISLVILDSIGTLSNSGRENEGESWLPLQAWALKLRRRGISVLFVHHSGKGGLQRGTSRREDILDTVINLRRPHDYHPAEGARFEVHFEKARGIYGEDVRPFEVKLVTDGSVQEWLLKDLEESVTERVAELLNEGILQKEIPELLGVSKGTVSKHKAKAIAAGLISTAGKTE